MKSEKPRDYDTLEARIRGASIDQMNREEACSMFVDVCWDVLQDADVSWLGFYVDHPDDPDDRRLVLGARRDKPACSPIGMHGACGQALRERVTLVVPDIRALGEGYVACDPRDASELVIPLADADGRWWGVFDLDSFRVGGFNTIDAQRLSGLLHIAGLTTMIAPIDTREHGSRR